MGMNKYEIHDALEKRRTAGIFDHFLSYTDAQLWTKGGINGTVTNPDADGGQLVLTTLGVQSNTAFVATTRKNFTFKAGTPLVGQCLINYTEANVNQAGIFFGFSSAFTGILTAITGVPLNPCSAVGIFKKPGDTFWSAFLSVGAVQQTVLSKTLAVQAAFNQELIIEVMIAGLNVEATFKVGSVGPAAVTGGGPGGSTYLYPSAGNPAFQPIKLTTPFAGAVAMGLGLNVLAGSASSEIVNTDYMGAEYLATP